MDRATLLALGAGAVIIAGFLLGYRLSMRRLINAARQQGLYSVRRPLSIDYVRSLTRAGQRHGTAAFA